jgi:predicted dehydrogenase
MPIYRHAANLIRKQGILGKLTSVSAHWNRPDRDEVRWSKDVELPAAVLAKYGYGSMQEFRNWRWYKKYSAGLMGDVGVHQLDVVNWFLDTPPTAVLASGGLDFHKTGEWYDNVKAVYDYRTADGGVRASYEAVEGSSFGGYAEVFAGTDRTMVISEDRLRRYILRESATRGQAWEDAAKHIERDGRDAVLLEVGTGPGSTTMPATAPAEEEKPAHQYHLENFIAAIRGEAKLTCPAEVAYASTVTALKANEAAETGRKIELKPEELVAASVW